MNIKKYVAHKMNSLKTLVNRYITLHSPEYITTVLNQVVDIRTIPKARAKLRMLQEADLELLKLFDIFCKKNGFRYFLSYGTLLGAFRHGGYIPWDDDIDLLVFKSEYYQIRKMLEKEIEGTGFILYGIEKCRFDDTTLRISHKDFPQLNLDIFYLFPSALTGVANSNVQKAARMLRKEYLSKYRWSLSDHENREELSAFRRNIDERYGKIIAECPEQEAKCFIPDIVDTLRSYSRDMVLPLQEVKFEGYSFPAPHDSIDMLNKSYGDWLSFPSRFDHHGAEMLGFTVESVEGMINHLKKCVAAGRFL